MNQQATAPSPTKMPVSLAANPKLSSWLKFSGTGQVTVSPGKVEIGQGIVTALAQIAADELDIDLSRVQMVRASTATSPNEGVTSGSLSIQQSGRALRHACATHMLENGADIRYIQALLGHENLSSTEVYTRVTIVKLKEVHEHTHPARLKPTGAAQAIAGTSTPPDPHRALLKALDAEADEDEHSSGL